MLEDVGQPRHQRHRVVAVPALPHRRLAEQRGDAAASGAGRAKADQGFHRPAHSGPRGRRETPCVPLKFSGGHF